MRTILLWTLAAAAPLAAQDTLAPIVVTATRLPTPLDQVAGTLTVLSGDDLRARGITQVLEALREVPGLHLVQSGGPGTVTSLFVRGAESDHVRVLLDGVPLNQPGGSIDLATLSLENVASIEVLRGPASVLYGSDAVAGVVHIRTRDASRTRLQAGARGGSRGTTVIEGDVAGRTGGASWTAGLTRTGTDGNYDLNSRWTSTGGSGTLLLAGATNDVRLTGHASAARLDYPTDFTGAPTDSNQFSKGRQWHIGLDAGHTWSPRLETRLLAGRHDERLRTENAPDSPAETDGSTNVTRFARTQADVRTNLRLGTAVLTAGGVIERQEFRNELVFTGSFPGGDTVDASRTAHAAYAQALLSPLSRLHLAAGARYESSRTGDSGTGRLHSAATWRLGASLHVTRVTRLRATAGTSFKEPTFFEQFGGGFSTGNRGLDPERAFSVELGIEQYLARGRLLLTATAFQQSFEDLVQFTFGPNPADPNYTNIAGARARGLELEARLLPGARTTISARYTRLHTEVTDSSPDNSTFAEGQSLLRRPAHAAGLVAATALGRGRFDASIIYHGTRDDLDFVNVGPLFEPTRVTLPAYVRVDAGVSWDVLARPGSSLAATLRVENLFDRRYEEVLYYPARSRTLLAGLRLST